MALLLNSLPMLTFLMSIHSCARPRSPVTEGRGQVTHLALSLQWSLWMALVTHYPWVKNKHSFKVALTSNSHQTGLLCQVGWKIIITLFSFTSVTEPSHDTQITASSPLFSIGIHKVTERKALVEITVLFTRRTNINSGGMPIIKCNVFLARKDNWCLDWYAAGIFHSICISLNSNQ